MNNNKLNFTKEIKEERENDNYLEFLQSINNHFNSIVNDNNSLFTTNIDTEQLWNEFINNIPEEARQYYTCHTCKHFIKKYGHLVSISNQGNIESVLWCQNIVPQFFKASIKAMENIVEKANVNGIFISDLRVLGTPITGEWKHMSVKLPINIINYSRLKNAGQLMAEKKENFKSLMNGLLEYSLDTVNQAIDLLNTETVYRGDKCLGIAKFLQHLYMVRQKAKNDYRRENITWLAVATAPTGFCHIKSSMIGTLLDDIQSGMNFNNVSRRFAEKMNPSNYMRSQVAPTQGNIQQAEKIVKKLGIANALKRRYANFEEIPCFIWKNNYKEQQVINKNIGVFSNIIPKEKTSNTNGNLPTTIMTWDKFKKTILPTAENIQVKINNPNRLMALVTASDSSAENILQWDNNFSWYYHGGIDGEIKRRVESAGGRYENNEIRCSLIWENRTDLDLHCITPNGKHIYFGDKKDNSSKGYLDVDMNVNGETLEPVENIRFSNNAPNGKYVFFVHNYRDRNGSHNPFKVELEINGEIYTYSNISSGTNYKEIIFEFEYQKGELSKFLVDGNNRDNSFNNDWNIDINKFIKVKGIINSPNTWDKQATNHGNHIFFLLDGCKDLSEGKGRGFFTEMLKPELYEIRKTLEAYTAQTPIENVENASACGIGYSKDNEWNLIVKVTANNSTRLIKIDRWG